MSVEATPFPAQPQTFPSPPPSLTRPHPPTRAWTVSESTASSSSGTRQLRSILLKNPPPRLEICVSSVDDVPPTTDLQTSETEVENDINSLDAGSNSNRTSSASCSSSDASAETSTSLATPSSSSSSTSSSITRTHADTLLAASTNTSPSASPSITFAPLPKIAPRKRNSSRPLGIAARGQILRQRRQMMQQDVTTYYLQDKDVDPNEVVKAMEEANSIPGGFRIVVTPEQAEQMRMQAAMQAHARAKAHKEESTLDEEEKERDKVGEDPIVALGRLLNDATKVLWRRVSSPKIKETANEDAKKQSKNNNPEPSTNSEERPVPRRGKSWPSRLRAASIYDAPLNAKAAASPSSPSKSHKSRSEASKASAKAEGDASSDSDSVDELWKKERAEDPMTRTIVSGSDDEDGFEHYVLSNDDGFEAEEGDVEEGNVVYGTVSSVDEEGEEKNRSIADVALEGLEIGKAC